MKKIFYSFLIIFAIILFSAFYAVYIEPTLLLSKTHSLYVPNWDKDLDGFKISVVSDIHIGSKFVNLSKLEKITQIINKQKPVLIVFLGDLMQKQFQILIFL